jgi:hypothetical protein
MAMRKVLNYVRAWGVPLILHGYEGAQPPGTYVEWIQELHGGPFGGAIHWPTRAIYWPRYLRATGRLPRALLHELAHVLCGEHPREVDEACSAMLAFEYYSGKHLKLGGWRRWMHDFRVREVWRKNGTIRRTDIKWPDLTAEERRGFLQDSLNVARERGLLNKDGTPTFEWAEEVRRVA